MEIQTIKYSNIEQTSLNVTLTDGSSMFVPWPSQTWHNETIQNWLILGNSIADAFTTQELNDQAKAEKIQELKQEGLTRIQSTMPAISSFDMLELVREMWLSTAPAARAATVDFQQIIDIYQAARDGVVYLNSATAAQITSYDVSTSPTWPA